MNSINPAAILVVATATVVGALAGATLIGLAVGLGIVLLATIFDRR